MSIKESKKAKKIDENREKIENQENKEITETEEDLKQRLEALPEEIKETISKAQSKLIEFKKQILKKHNYIETVCIVPPVASQIIEEEEEVLKENPEEKIVHVVIVIPDEKAKELKKLTEDAISIVKEFKPKIWLHIKTLSQVWEIGFDGKYQLLEAISMSFPLYDKGLLGGLRSASIHKMLILKKFERYVVSYVMAGSFARGTTLKTSDIDIAIIIDDTDVKRMSRYELKERLRAMIYTMALEASEKAGVKNKLSPQIYILTEFWEAVKDAHPVIFTFIRDGVPLYDRGAFMPWKLLLRMGKIKPSPEAIDMFMSLGEKVSENVKRKLNDILLDDIYWGVITPSQAVLMLYGLAPPTPKETVKLMKEVFYDNEKLLEIKYIKILDKIVDIYKRFEHEKIKFVSGNEIDLLVKECEEYIKRLKQLMEQIEKRINEKEVLRLYESVFDVLQTLFGKYGEQNLIEKFKKELILNAKLERKNLISLIKLTDFKKKIKIEKITKNEINDLRKSVNDLLSALIEYSQRKEMMELNKKKIDILYENKKGELFIFKDFVFFIPDLVSEKIKKIHFDGKVEEVMREELKEYLSSHKETENRLSVKLINLLKKVIGDFEIKI